MDPEAKPSENDESRQSSSLSDLDSDIDIDSDSSSTGASGGDGPDTSDAAARTDRIEWLATARQRRVTAGNRMKSMLANEEPDSDLELLFAEDDDDQGFSNVDDDGSDVQMDSSSDDDDDNNAADELEGEKELERQAKERRTAQRKRKAQDAIPAKFKKKVRIDPTSSSSRGTPAPRPKKKSERASWLPSVADLPTRASSRQTTRLSKEQLHQQMVEREAKRLKQVAQMEKKAAKLEALKKPPMTQEERLHEAALVEKRNSKSLNRWEEAEKHREEERMAKLAALNERKLKGPVITFWSGMGEWVDGSLKNVGQHMVVEEQPKKKREKVDKGTKAKAKDQDQEKDKKADDGQPAQPNKATADVKMEEDKGPDEKKDNTPAPTQQKASQEQPPADTTTPAPAEGAEKAARDAANEGTTASESTAAKTDAETIAACPPSSTSVPQDEAPRLMAMPPKPLTSGLAAPQPPPPPSSPPHIHGSLAAPSGMARPHEPKPSGVLAAPVLAPPPGVDINGTSTPMLGYNTSSPRSNVLAPPNTSQRPSPPSIPKPAAEQPVSDRPGATLAPKRPTPDPHLQPITNEAAPSKSASPRHSEPPPGLKVDPAANRNAIVYQNFDENAIRDKIVQTQILFGRRMNKLSKPTPAPVCVITNHPARYRDPQTGLPYFNTYAYREIQRLRRGDYRWSKILGAWVGSGTYAACGVPERFLHPERKPPAAATTPITSTTKPPNATGIDSKTPKLESATDEEANKTDRPPIQPKVEDVEVVQASNLTLA